MSAWAFRCRPCTEGKSDWFVAAVDVENMSPDTTFVRIKVGGEWKCAVLDRSQTITVEDQLLRTVIASNEEDCPECVKLLTPATESADESPTDKDRGLEYTETKSNSRGSHPGAVKVQVAEMSIQGIHLVVIAVPVTLVSNPGEALLAIEELKPFFKGATVVLMAQADDGSPRYYGEPQIVKILDGVSIDNMPWEERSIG